MMASPQDSPSSTGGKVIAMPNMQSENLAVAIVLAGGLVSLALLRKGMKGIGDLQLFASAMGAVEWLAYAAIVGGTLRVAQINFPENKLVQALAFIY
jgi:hypothetical protein